MIRLGLSIWQTVRLLLSGATVTPSAPPVGDALLWDSGQPIALEDGSGNLTQE